MTPFTLWLAGPRLATLLWALSLVGACLTPETAQATMRPAAQVQAIDTAREHLSPAQPPSRDAAPARLQQRAAPVAVAHATAQRQLGSQGAAPQRTVNSLSGNGWQDRSIDPPCSAFGVAGEQRARSASDPPSRRLGPGSPGQGAAA